MKKFFKFLPVALGVLALASCSDDLMTNSNANADENALYFSIDNSENTRAGMVGDATDAYKTLKFRWTKGDQIRVYDKNLALYDIYQYDGASFDESENKTANKFTNTIDKLLSSYEIGIYPADQVEAVYLDKDDREIKHIEMTLPVEYKYEEATSGKEGYRCDIPMYGNIDNVANSVDNQMNMMTAWTNIYLRNLPEDVKYIAVVTESKNLTGIYEAQVSRTAAKNAEPWLKEKVNADPTKFGKMVWSKVNLTDPAALKEKAGISFPLPVADYSGEKISIFGLKESAGKTPTQVTDDYTEWETLVAAGNAIEIATRNDLTFTKRRQCWQVKYTFTYYLDTDAFDPFRPGEITKVLEAQKNNIVGDFSIVPYSKADGLSPVDPTKAKCLTSGAGDNYTHRIEIPNIAEEQKANIILDFTGAGIKYDEALQIYDMNPETNQFAGKLTIKTGKIQGGSDKAKIEINLPKAEVWIVGDGATSIGNVDVQNAKVVHIGDGQTMTFQDDTRKTWFKGGKLYIEDNTDVKFVYAQAYSGYIDPESEISGHAEELILNPGGRIANTAFIETNCNVTVNGAGYDGVANKEYTGTYNGGLATIMNLDCSKVTTDILVQSQGFSRIGGLVAPTTGNKLNHLKFTTKLFQKSASDKTPVAGANLSDYLGSKAIFTGAQLAQAAKDGVAAETYLMADEVDMNGVEWTGGSISANFFGFNHSTATGTWKDITNADAKKTATSTGKNVIKGITLKATADNSDGNGLFNLMNGAATIAGLELDGVTYSVENTMSTNNSVAALVAYTSVEATVANVTVKDLAIDAKGGSNFGGLFASAGNAVNINNCSVTTTDAGIKARAYVGGLIGKVNGSYTINIKNSSADVKAVELKLVDGTALQSQVAGTWASFIGGSPYNATIKIQDGKFGTALTKDQKGAGVNNTGLRFGADANENDIPFFGGNPWIGRFTGGAGELTTYLFTEKKKYDQCTYYAESMVKVTKTAGADYTVAGGDSEVPGSGVTYNGTVTTGNPNGYKYGYNIYAKYNETFLGYNNTYVGGK